MTMSHFFSASMSKASFSVVSLRAWAGALPPALDVEKKTGSTRRKSPSACMRSMRTEPTMPRQPTRPTSGCVLRVMSSPFQFDPVFPGSSGREGRATNRSLLALGNRLLRDRGHDGIAHGLGADLRGAFCVDVRGAQPLREHVLDR